MNGLHDYLITLIEIPQVVIIINYLFFLVQQVFNGLIFFIKKIPFKEIASNQQPTTLCWPNMYWQLSASPSHENIIYLMTFLMSTLRLNEVINFPVKIFKIFPSALAINYVRNSFFGTVNLFTTNQSKTESDKLQASHNTPKQGKKSHRKNTETTLCSCLV